MDRNDVYLEGRIRHSKFGKTKTGKPYATFALVVHDLYNKEYRESTEGHKDWDSIRIMVFDKKLVDYLRAVKMQDEQKAIVNARISSGRTEHKGETFIQNVIIARSISIVKVVKTSDATPLEEGEEEDEQL